MDVRDRARRARGAGVALVVGCIALGSLAGCGFPEHRYRDEHDADGPDALADALADTLTDAHTDALVDADADGTTDARADAGDARDARPIGPPPTACAPPSTTNACDVVLDITGTVETIDGAGDEFCAAKIPARTFTVEGAAHTQPTPPPPGLTQRVAVRAALSAYGFHVHVQVLDDPQILVAQPDLVRGDAVEIFLRGAAPTPLDGDAIHDHALHYVIAPPVAGGGADAAVYVGERRDVSPDPAFWSARVVDGGYEVELRVPWTTLGNQPTPGDHVGLDVAVDVKDDPAATDRAARAFLELAPPPSAGLCATVVQPSCDDRTWCLAPAYVK